MARAEGVGGIFSVGRSWVGLMFRSVSRRAAIRIACGRDAETKRCAVRLDQTFV